MRARDTDLDRIVAIKELRLPDDVGDGERFTFYARIAEGDVPAACGGFQP